jgi:hypothetical protein
MTEGPDPTLAAAAGGRELLSLPGPDEGVPCNWHRRPGLPMALVAPGYAGPLLST